jgi:hypothetical protein
MREIDRGLDPVHAVPAGSSREESNQVGIGMSEKKQSTAAKSIQNTIKGLTAFHRFGWLRGREIGNILWPKTKSRHLMGAQACRRWVECGYLIERRLELNYGNAFVLSLVGAEWLVENAGLSATSGAKLGTFLDEKDIGTESGKPRRWSPAVTFSHDLLAASFLTTQLGVGNKIYTEREILKCAPTRKGKIPDGLVKAATGKWYWVEVENSRKTGENLRVMAEAMVDAGKGFQFDKNIKIEGALLVCKRGANHLKRTIEAMEKALPAGSSVTLTTCQVEVHKGIIETYEIKSHLVKNNFVGSAYEFWVKRLGWTSLNQKEEEFLERPAECPFQIRLCMVYSPRQQLHIEIYHIDDGRVVETMYTQIRDRTKGRDLAKDLLLNQAEFTKWYEKMQRDIMDNL